MNQNQTFKYIQIGVYAAIIIIAITFIRVPMPSAISNSFVHPGNALVILAVLLMGFKRGTISALLGLFIFDVMNGYGHEVQFTLLENFIVLLVVNSIYTKVLKKDDKAAHIIWVGVIGAICKVILILIKFVAQQMLLGSQFKVAIAIALTGLPASLFTALVTAILVPTLYFPMKQVFVRYHKIGE